MDSHIGDLINEKIQRIGVLREQMSDSPLRFIEFLLLLVNAVNENLIKWRPTSCFFFFRPQID